MPSFRDFVDRVAHERWVRFWTVLGGIAAVLGLAVTLVVTLVGNDAPAPTTQPTLSPGPSLSPALPPISSTVDPSPTASPTDTLSPSPTATTPSPASPGTLVHVSLGDLCNSPGAVAYFCSPSPRGTIQVGDQVFTYYAEGNTADSPNWSSYLEFPKNTCSEIDIQFAASYQGPLTINARVIQSGAPAISATTHTGHIGTLKATLNGSPFDLQWNSGNGTALFAAGYAVCSTDSSQ
jgi:hypothetical protein